MVNITHAETILRLRLFMGAYAALFLLLALRFTPFWLMVSCLAIGAFSIASLWVLLFYESPRAAADVVEIAEVYDEGAAISGFLASYLLPFLTIAEPTSRDVGAYALFLSVAAVVWIRSDVAQINPTLYLFGYRVISLRTTGGWRGFAIVRRIPSVGDHIRKVSLSNRVLIEVRSPRQAPQ